MEKEAVEGRAYNIKTEQTLAPLAQGMVDWARSGNGGPRRREEERPVGGVGKCMVGCDWCVGVNLGLGL